ncbi:GNAT family N-acetyltransferase [Bacillus sp. PS06]|uniref:GNAT family N-acetyltransferase n=1 Tax=Bacillus sp. PS06 TaxID=2764176 RepID=UPI001785C83C|nr:GNAT family N-acetyltransferase [Bacillus sp. PS06]MBD8069723.1 GNAT family N-acetyltransferase [Bacillus sp. PS06]
MNIRRIGKDETPPMNLLLLADPSRQLVEEYLTAGECFVAESDAQILGAYIVLPTSPGTMELVNIAVSDEHQGKGIGRSLVMHAIETTKRNGYKTIDVGTGNSSIGQLAFYQKCGFRMTSIDQDFFIRNYPEEIFENGIQCRDMVRLSRNL